MSISNSAMDRTARAYVTQQAVEKIDLQIQQLDVQVLNKTITAEAAQAEKLSLEAQKPKESNWKVNLKALLIGMLLFALVVAVIRSLTEPARLLWLFYIPALTPAVGQIADLLAPLLAISVAIERLLETTFDAYEQSTKAAADVLKAPKDTLGWIDQEYQQAFEAASQAAQATGVKATTLSLKRLDKAEERLAQAEKRLRSWTDAPEYKAWKRALTIWVGLLVGLLVSILGDLGMLKLMGVPCPRLLDMFITGLVIGAGPGPMHSLIGILQSGKNAVENLAELAKGKAIREAVEAVNTAANRQR